MKVDTRILFSIIFSNGAGGAVVSTCMSVSDAFGLAHGKSESTATYSGTLEKNEKGPS